MKRAVNHDQHRGKQIMNDIDKEKIKSAAKIADVFAYFGREVNSGGNVLCPFHADNKPSCHLYPDRFQCFGCNEGGDVFAAVQKLGEMTFPEAARWLADRYNVTLTGNGSRPQAARPQAARPQPKAARIAQKEPKPIDPAAVQFWTDYANRMHEMIRQPEGQAGLDYFTGRGISQETIDRFKLGYDPKLQRVVVPCGNGFCVRRDITDQQRAPYMNPKSPENAKPGEHGIHPALFNGAALYQAEKPVFIVEGAINALSILQAGGQAVALNSASNVDLLRRAIEQTRPAAEIIVWFDDDQAGQKAAKAVSELLKNHDIKHAIHGGKAK